MFFFVTKALHKNKDNCDRKSAKKNVKFVFYTIVLKTNCPESDLYGSTKVESPICRVRSQICTQYRLGVRFVRACHLALAISPDFRNKKTTFSLTTFLPCQKQNSLLPTVHLFLPLDITSINIKRYFVKSENFCLATLALYKEKYAAYELSKNWFNKKNVSS